MAGDTSVDMMLNVLPGTFTGIFALNAGLSSINQVFQNMTKNVDTHFGLLEAGVVSLTALTAQFAKNAADAFGQYEQGMKIVQAVSGQSASAIAELGQKANQFSVEYRMDIDQLTEGLQTLGRAGLKSAQEQSEVLENGLETAKLEGRDLNSVLQELIQNTTLLGGNLKSSNFGEQTDYVNDLLVATSMTAPINTHDISETLKYSGGMLAAGGGTITDEAGNMNDEGKKLIEDYMGTVAAFAQKGVTGSIAGTALRAFFNKPATQDTSVTEALAKIHLKPEYLWEEGEEQMKPVSEQIGLIQSQMDKLGISQMDKLQIWSKIVGGKMGQQMIKLDASDIKEITKDIQEANSAENLATQSMQTYQAAMKQASEAGQHAMRSFGEHVARFLKPIAQILTPIFELLSNPAVSTAFFGGFLALLGRAWASIKRIITGIRAEVGLLKSSLQSLVLNQPTRKQIMGGRIHGGGVMPGYHPEQPITPKLTTVPQTMKGTSAQFSGEMNQAFSQILAKVSNIRDILVGVGNRIKEEAEAIHAILTRGITVNSQKINQTITTASTKFKNDFNSAANQVNTSFNTRMRQNISSSAQRMKSEFQAALNSVTYNPKIKPTQMGVAAGLAQQKVDTHSPSYMFLQDTQRKANQAEASYQRRLNSLEQSRSNVVLSRQVGAKTSQAEKQLEKLKGHQTNLDKELDYVAKQLNKQNRIISEANTKLKTDFESLDASQKKEISTRKTNAEQQRLVLLDKQRLLEEEKYYKQEEIRIQVSVIQSLRNLKASIDRERLSLLKGNGTTGPKGVGILPGTVPPIIQTTNINGYVPSQSDFTFKGYGMYGSKKSMPFVPGMFNWSNVPKEYHPNYGTAGNSAPWLLNTNAKTGNALLGTLRQQEVAMTREMAQALGITDKELIVFYERLIQVNAALSKTMTISNGKVRTSNPMDMEKSHQLYHQIPRDSLQSTGGHMVPVYGANSSSSGLSGRQIRGLRALFDENTGINKKLFEKEAAEASQKTIAYQNKMTSQLISQGRYNLPDTAKIEEALTKEQKLNQVQGASYPAAAMMTYNQMEESAKKQQQITEQANKRLTGRRQRIRASIGSVWNASGAGNIMKGTTNAVKGFGSVLGKATSFMGGPFFAAMMAVDVGMQIWNHYQQEYTKKIEEVTQKLDEMVQKQSEAEQIFFEGRHEEGQSEITGWSEENPDATAEEKEDALLGAYEDIYDNRNKGLSALEENTQQLAIATEQVKQASDTIGRAYLSGDFFSGNGLYQQSVDTFHFEKNKDAGLLSEFATMGIAGGASLLNLGLNSAGLYGSNKYVDKYGTKLSGPGESYFTDKEVVLADWQQKEDYPWLKEFGPILAADVWKTGTTKDGLNVMLGEDGYNKLSDQISSTGGWDNSAWTRQGYNMNKYFGTDTEQNKLQMGLKNYQKDFSKLAKQTRKFEKATGVTALGAFNRQFKKTGDIKKTLKNLSVQDPKLTSYLKSLSIKTGMSAQQVLLAAQLQQLQEMQAIAKDQVTPRMENLVMSAYDQVAYGKQTLGTVQGSGDGAISAAQNAAAIANLLNAELETKLDEQSYQQYVNDMTEAGVDPDKRKYKNKEDFAAAVSAARNDGQDTWIDKYAKNKFTSYAATNFMMWNPELSEADAAKKAEEWYNNLDSNVKTSAIYDTLRKGATGALKNQILAAYDASLDEQEGSGSGGGSGSGDKDKGDTGTRKERVDLVLCNRKTIPKLNVNLFKKPPSFTILNKNFKLRDVRINSEDKPKAIMAAIKNSFIDIQKRTDPKIIQDEDAVYDPAAATDGTNVPSGSAKTNTS